MPRREKEKEPVPSVTSYAHAAARTALALIVREARGDEPTAAAESSRSNSGFEAIERSASEALLDVLTRYLRSVGATARAAANHANRSESNLADLLLGLDDVHDGTTGGGYVRPRELLEFLESTPEIAFPVNLAAIPVPRPPLSETEPVQHDGRSAAAAAEARPAFVPDFLPPLPPRHTYARTVEYNTRECDPPAAKKRRARNRRNAQDSLIAWYLKSIGRHELLTLDDEQELAGDVRELSRWQSVRDDLEKQLDRTPTDKEWSHAVGFDASAEDLVQVFGEDPLDEFDDDDFDDAAEAAAAAREMEFRAAADPTFTSQLQSLRTAKDRMINSNLRLVVKIAKDYANRGLGLQDLIQEGTLGLITAVDKFDPTHASQAKFSSYASWWIKQRVSRAVGKARTIRLPARMPSLLHAITKARDEYRMAMGREPTDEELACSLKISVPRLRLCLSAARDPLSLDSKLSSGSHGGPSASGEGSRTLADVIPDARDRSDPQEVLESRMRRQALARTLQQLSSPGRGRVLTAEEVVVLCNCYDLIEDRGRPLTHEEVGERFGRDAEWAKEVEAHALKKLKNRPQLRNVLSTRHLAAGYD